MEQYFPDSLINLVVISMSFSLILMTMIQKFKCLDCINKSWYIWLLNLILSFSIGIPYGMYFYHLALKDAVWVGLFSFIGAPTLYQVLKNQTIISYTPTSIDDKVNISKENEIKREDV